MMIFMNGKVVNLGLAVLSPKVHVNSDSLSHYFIEETYQNIKIYPGTFFQGRDLPKWRRWSCCFTRRPTAAFLYRKNTGCGTGMFRVKGLAESA